MVTGGESMVGRHVCDILHREGAVVDPVPHSEVDLTSEYECVKRFEDFQPEYVIHAAGYNGGIEWNRRYPERVFRRTVRMAMNVLECALEFEAFKTVSLISSCAYPNLEAEVIHEEQFWDGPCNPTIECHGYSKRILNAYSRQVVKEYPDRDFFCVVLNNCYGPWDSYNPIKSKVVAAMIRRFVEAKQNQTPSVVCWGTGSPKREFVYVEDAAEAIVFALREWSHKKGDLLNIATGGEVTIKALATTISELVGYTGEIYWDTTKPNGQMRKALSSSLLTQAGFRRHYSLREGLQKAITWYLENKEMADARIGL